MVSYSSSGVPGSLGIPHSYKITLFTHSMSVSVGSCFYFGGYSADFDHTEGLKQRLWRSIWDLGASGDLD